MYGCSVIVNRRAINVIYLSIYIPSIANSIEDVHHPIYGRFLDNIRIYVREDTEKRNHTWSQLNNDNFDN